MNIHPFHHYPSTWVAIASIVLSVFTSQPTFAALIAHAVNIGLIAIMLWLAHWEGQARAVNG